MSDIAKVTEEGWELKDVDYVINALEDLGGSIEKHSIEVKSAAGGVEKAMSGMSEGVSKALKNLAKEDTSDATVKKITSIISLSLDAFHMKQSGLVKNITASNRDLTKTAKEIIDILGKPKKFEHEVERNKIGLISKIISTEIK